MRVNENVFGGAFQVTIHTSNNILECCSLDVLISDILANIDNEHLYSGDYPYSDTSFRLVTIA